MNRILARAIKGNSDNPGEKGIQKTFSLRIKDADDLKVIMAQYGINNESLMIRQLIAEKMEEGK